MGVKCPVPGCNKECKDERGLGLHIGGSHRELILKRGKLQQLTIPQSSQINDPGMVSMPNTVTSDWQMEEINNNLVDLQKQIHLLAGKSGVNPMGMFRSQPQPGGMMSVREMMEFFMMFRMVRAMEMSENKSAMDPFIQYNTIDKLIERKIDEDYEEQPSVDPMTALMVNALTGGLGSGAVKKNTQS